MPRSGSMPTGVALTTPAAPCSALATSSATRAVQTAAQLHRQRFGLGAIGIEDAEFGDAEVRERECDRLADAAGADQRDRSAIGGRRPISAIARSKPVVSVLWPISRPSRTTTVLTAPISRARADSSSSNGIDGFLVGKRDVDAGEAETPDAVEQRAQACRIGAREPRSVDSGSARRAHRPPARASPARQTCCDRRADQPGQEFFAG